MGPDVNYTTHPMRDTIANWQLLFVRLPFVKVKGRKTLNVSLHQLGSYLLAHRLLSIGLPTQQKLMQQSEKFAGSVDRYSQVMSSFLSCTGETSDGLLNCI